MNYYQVSKRRYRDWCKKYNDLQITVVYRDFLYDHLKLSQPQARVFHHFVWKHNDEDTEFQSAKFRGIAGIGMRASIPDFLREFQRHLEQFNVHFRKFYFDRDLKKPHYYALHIDIDDTAFRNVDSAAEWEDVESVPLSPTPVKLPKLKQKRVASADVNSITAPTEPETRSTAHMQELIDYLHGRKVSYNIGVLAKRNGVDLDGQNKIIYLPKLRTDRVFSDGKIANDKCLRQQLYHGCYVVDICNAQLSIIAKLWNLPKVSEFLQSGGKIWDTLMEFTGLDKPTLKDFLYSSIYGMEEDHLKLLYDNKLFSHELIVELIGARNQEIERIVGGKALTTAFGDVLHAREFEQAKSILSTQVQSYEQILVLHAFRECIRDSKEAVMVLYLFDGFFLKFSHNENSALKLIKRIEESMSDKGREFGMQITCSHEMVVDEFRN